VTEIVEEVMDETMRRALEQEAIETALELADQLARLCAGGESTLGSAPRVSANYMQQRIKIRRLRALKHEARV
jgi:hypothetical protein